MLNIIKSEDQDEAFDRFYIQTTENNFKGFKKIEVKTIGVLI